MIGVGLFCANISSIHLVDLAASGYQHGLVIGNFEWMASFCLILLGMVFAPFYFRSKTPPCQNMSSGATVRAHGPSWPASSSCQHFSCTSVSACMQVPKFWRLSSGSTLSFQIGISLATSVYTILGGLKGVMNTDSVQAVLLLLGAALVGLIQSTNLRYL